MAETTTLYNFPNESGIRKSFTSKEAALKYVKDKLPTDGKNWVLRKTITTIEEETIESTRKLIENKDILKRIIDRFIEKATADNIKFDGRQYKCNNEKYANIEYREVEAYLFAEQEGFPWEKLDDWFSNKDGILEGRFDNYYGEVIDYNDRYGCSLIASELALWYIISDKFNIDLNDIKAELDDYDHKELTNKYPEAKKYLENNYNRRGIYDNIIYGPMENQEALDIYKERLKKYPIEHAFVNYNIGDYKPCHNYKIEFPEEFDPNYTGKQTNKLGDYFNPIPGIMFRDNDIYITYSNYIGRHVSYRQSKRVDETEELYNYCVKNLK